MTNFTLFLKMVRAFDKNQENVLDLKICVFIKSKGWGFIAFKLITKVKSTIHRSLCTKTNLEKYPNNSSCPVFVFILLKYEFPPWNSIFFNVSNNGIWNVEKHWIQGWGLLTFSKTRQWFLKEIPKDVFFMHMAYSISNKQYLRKMGLPQLVYFE